MRDYETIFILNPNIDEEEAEKVNLKMQEVLTSNGGELLRVEKWGKRRLAYEVKKQKKGNYILIRYQAESAAVAELERNFKMSDPVIKFMTIRLEKDMLLDEAAKLEKMAEDEVRATEAAAAAEVAEVAEAEAAAAAEAAPAAPEEADKTETE